jgi:hypothetical protein
MTNEVLNTFIVCCLRDAYRGSLAGQRQQGRVKTNGYDNDNKPSKSTLHTPPPPAAKSLNRLGIEQIPEPVAQHIQAEHGDRDGAAGEDRERSMP